MKAIKKIVVIFALSIIHHYAYAATYYIDSQLGNDTWSGKVPIGTGTPSTDGPWLSLDRLATATLSPGDVVELQCGSKWIQTLRIKNSGTADRPITIRSSSSTCNTPPSIDGGQRIDAHSWVPYNDAIYKAPWPTQKFENGSLAGGIAGWTSWSTSADQKLAHESNCPDSTTSCAGFTSTLKTGGSIAISNDFLVEGGVRYSGELSLRVPNGAKVKVLVRRGSPPYEAISAVQWITGNSTWQKLSFAFAARYNVPNARLDIEVPNAGVTLHFKNASLKPAFSTPIGAWVGDIPLLPAYHPNRGHDSIRPTSVYANAAADGNAVPNSVGGTGSNYLDIGSTLALPQAIKPGNRLRIRVAPFHLDEATVTKVEGNRLHFDPPTRYRVLAGQGFFLIGELGMLDSPGEWFYDASTASTYAWAPAGTPPSDQIRLSILEKGIDISNRSNVIIEGINILNTGLGIDLTSTQNVTLRSTSIKSTIREGILATNARYVSIISNRIRQTGGDAISAKDSKTVRVEENDIVESGVTLVGGRVWSLPSTTYAAIFTGPYSRITGNRIDTAASDGIWTLANGVVANGVVENNVILNSCLLMNDCGGIYVNYSSPNTRISSNLIEHVSGNVDGLAANARTHGIGIYLDDNSTQIIVENNTVAWADYGVQVHDSYSNRISGNLLYGNRNNQLWFQEHTKKKFSTGDVHDNHISGNRFFPTTSAAAVNIEGEVGSMTSFGVLSENHYSSLLSQRVVSESWPTHNLAYTLPEWQKAAGYEGRPLQDAGSSQVVQSGYATFVAAGSNIVPNGGLTNGLHGWTSWNETGLLSTRTHEACPFGPCLRITAGGSKTLASTPNFSVESGRAYRVSFDARTSSNGNFIAPLVRRGGPIPLYERLMSASEGYSGSTEWRRYVFVFTATKTVIAGDPTTGDLGARLDFENILPGQIFWIGNVEIVPLRPVENTLRTQLLTKDRKSVV